jgi:DNA-binding winged helix-turn-helix (wHTH) protein/Tol biopolymer transport system component
MEEPAGRVRFDAFEVDLRSGELLKSGVRLKLAEQPFTVLALLVTRPGELVTREELQKALWPGDTLTDFDRGINKAINRLRDTLGDSADAPRFIETLPKRGYRFIGSLVRTSASAIVAAEPAPAVPHSSSALAKRRSWPWLLVGALALAGLVSTAAWLSFDEPQPGEPEPLIRSSLLPPAGRTFVPYSLALSRDGTHLAFVAERTDGLRSLWTRAMASTTATEIAGTAGATLPFWSPDLRHVAFFADRKLKVVDLAGGVVRDLADARRPSGGTWSSEDVIVFAPDVNGPLYRIPAAGGMPVAVTRTPQDAGLTGHRWPVFLPDNHHFLFVSFSDARPSDNAPELRAGSLDTTESTEVEWTGSRSVAYALDRLVYVSGGTLYAQPFDREALRTRGPPAAVAGVELAGAPAFFPSPLSASMNGVLVFQSLADLPSQLTWLDDHGREQGVLSGMKYGGPAVSPDGRWVAGSCEGPRSGTSSICVSDIARGVISRVTEGPYDRFPAWSPDGRQIAYASNAGIYRVPADGSAAPQFVSHRGIPTGWSRDGRVLSFGTRHGAVSLALSAPDTHEVTELGQGAEGQLSPDRAWLAYIDRNGLVIQPFPAMGARVNVASDAGQPRWSRDGRTLFFIRSDKKLMSVDFDPGTGLAGVAEPVAQTRIVGAALVGHQYDVVPERGFLVNVRSNDAAPLTLMSGWASSPSQVTTRQE